MTVVHLQANACDLMVDPAGGVKSIVDKSTVAQVHPNKWHIITTTAAAVEDMGGAKGQIAEAIREDGARDNDLPAQQNYRSQPSSGAGVIECQAPRPTLIDDSSDSRPASAVESTTRILGPFRHRGRRSARRRLVHPASKFRNFNPGYLPKPASHDHQAASCSIAKAANHASMTPDPDR